MGVHQRNDVNVLSHPITVLFDLVNGRSFVPRGVYCGFSDVSRTPKKSMNALLVLIARITCGTENTTAAASTDPHMMVNLRCHLGSSL